MCRRDSIQAAAREVKEKIEKGAGGTVEVQVHESQPVVTLEELEENTELIGRCSTRAVSNANRDANIRLMCEAVNGLVLEPGETLSINELVGERTAEKGFKMCIRDRNVAGKQYGRFDLDEMAQDGFFKDKSPEDIEALLNQVVEEGMFNISINSNPVFEDCLLYTSRCV